MYVIVPLYHVGKLPVFVGHHESHDGTAIVCHCHLSAFRVA